ncbi:hypothetical protein T01_8626 [Trichinella spiralis]|uniref:Uncharacterized protein n=1 Tax=Trichinella spiralis TaxID=6334 RepID=A0A0V1BEH9_TRISP|nr:hypothetical protein T01_8626 [Trichinella spiralis]
MLKEFYALEGSTRSQDREARAKQLNNLNSFLYVAKNVKKTTLMLIHVFLYVMLLDKFEIAAQAFRFFNR